MINISSKPLLEDQRILLNKGLNFVPTNSLDQFEFVKDFNKLCRKIRSKIFFAEKGYQRKPTPQSSMKLKTTSTFDPPINNNTVETFKQLVTQEVTKKWNALSESKQKSNVTRKEKIALQQLREDESIILKKADKGGAIVLMDTTQYMEEALKQLSDVAVYQHLKKDPTVQYKKEVDDIIEEAFMLGHISLETKKALVNDHPRVPILYLVPKVHKDLKAPPGRPIVSSIGSILQPFATYVDSYLQRIVKTLPSCLKDTTQFLLGIKEIKAEEVTLMGTLDIKSLSLLTFLFLKGLKLCGNNYVYFLDCPIATSDF